MNTYQQHINRLKHLYLRRRLGELMLLAMGAGLLTFALMYEWQGASISAWLIGVLTSVGVFVGRYFQLQLHRLSEQDIAIYLNRHFKELEDSTDLLSRNAEELGPLQQIQRRKLLCAFDQAAKNISWPEQWRKALLLFGLGLIACWAVLLRGQSREAATFGLNAALTDSLTQAAQQEIAAELEAYDITITPPAYTGMANKKVEDFNLKIPEGSRVNWALTFSGAPDKVMVIFSNGDSTSLTQKGNTFSLAKTLTQSGYYSLNWRDRGTLKSSDFYKLEIVEDQVPRVAINDQEQFVEFPWQEEIEVTVESSLADDYGLTEAYVIATVSKGSGESVKFREERLPFIRPKQISGKQVRATLQLNTKTLGMEAGDELYYYVEAWDNHRPQRQSNRTETYFIQIRDTSTQMISFEGGLGVDLMPEYFRSQRQIIIDSEKLLGEKASIKKKEFDDRSNTLAYDQKVLRLRYGQFLGEEFESGMTEESHEETAEAAPHDEEEVLEKYGHAHDTDNEHNLVEEHDHEHDENHNPEEQDESPLEAFVHAHDNMEEATFFIQSVKAKLRAALSMMWDAELHLRMNDPAQSLPYQYKILKLLKEISQDSRIYVHRTGFDAPPLKEEKRLTGDLDEINNPRTKVVKSDPESYPAIRKALPLLEQWVNQKPQELVATHKEVLLAAGNELAAAAIEQPDLYLTHLGALRSILDGDLTVSKIRMVREAFWSLLPRLPRPAAGNRNASHRLQDVFIQQLKAQSY